MLKWLIDRFGKQRLNSMTKYPSILTLHKLGEKGRLTDELTTVFKSAMYATEKIDGTNVRIICHEDEYIIGSREFLLCHSDDMFFDPAQGIVEAIREQVRILKPNVLTVIYGELYGGKVTAQSKQYGTDKLGFRAFDVAEFSDLSVLDFEPDAISRWRETETPEGMKYGQPFLTLPQMVAKLDKHIELVPIVSFEPKGTGHGDILSAMKDAIPTTRVALSESALNRPEGLILRNADRSKIVKIRFEDYQRTLR